MTRYKLQCPHCHASCWVNNGNEDDVTVPDIEAVRCHACKAVFRVDAELDVPLEDMYTVDSTAGFWEWPILENGNAEAARKILEEMVRNIERAMEEDQHERYKNE
jgi:hypothetical protein